MESKTQSNTVLDKAKECIHKKDYKAAKKWLEIGISNGQENSEIYYQLGNILYQLGDIGKAIKAFHKSLSFDDGHTDAAIALSVLYNDIGRYDEARKVFEKASDRVRQKSPGDCIEDKHVNRKFSFKHDELGELYMTYGRFDEALFELNKASQLDPENLEVRIKIAKVYAKKGFISKAFEELKVLKNEHPEYTPARIALGILYYGNGNVIEAQTEWERVLAKDVTNAEASMYLNLSKTATETSLNV